jgi:hypothetical protein
MCLAGLHPKLLTERQHKPPTKSVFVTAVVVAAPSVVVPVEQILW